MGWEYSSTGIQSETMNKATYIIAVDGGFDNQREVSTADILGRSETLKEAVSILLQSKNVSAKIYKEIEWNVVESK